MMKYLTVIFLFVVLCSCSVKEDRMGCPGDLTVVPSGKASNSGGDVLISIFQGGRLVKQALRTQKDYESGLCVFSVPRKETYVTVFEGIVNMQTVTGETLNIIHLDNQCDSIYAGYEYVDIASDETHVWVDGKKRYTCVYIRFLGRDPQSFPTVSGYVEGYDVRSFEPAEGVFRFAPLQTGSLLFDEFFLRIPGQKDRSLMLHIRNGGNRELDIPLGEMIAATGYDFGEESLYDVTVTVDISSALVSIRLGDWTETEFPILTI